MDMSSYNKLKKFSKKEHVVYKYLMDIKSIYSPKVTPIKPNIDDINYEKQMDYNKYGMSAGNVLIVNNQKVYLFDDTYHQIMFDKKIILYIVKCENDYVLYDYERVIEQD